MSTLNRAIEIATKAHEGAKDKYGSPYINELKIDTINCNITP
jgi:(p)ppGpp synthase/HD superfamily hydrolase